MRPGDGLNGANKSFRMESQAVSARRAQGEPGVQQCASSDGTPSPHNMAIRHADYKAAIPLGRRSAMESPAEGCEHGGACYPIRTPWRGNHDRLVHPYYLYSIGLQGFFRARRSVRETDQSARLRHDALRFFVPCQAVGALLLYRLLPRFFVGFFVFLPCVRDRTRLGRLVRRAFGHRGILAYRKSPKGQLLPYCADALLIFQTVPYPIAPPFWVEPNSTPLASRTKLPYGYLPSVPSKLCTSV